MLLEANANSKVENIDFRILTPNPWNGMYKSEKLGMVDKKDNVVKKVR